MAIGNTVGSWGWPARLLHWIMAGVILFLLVLGFYMAEVLSADDSDTMMRRYELTQTHKSWGFVAFALACLRLAWRAVNPVPDLPDGMPTFERAAARGAHIALYALIFAMPLSGWLMASASPYNDPDSYFHIKNMVFGLFELPDPIDPGSETLEARFKTIHFYCALALVLVLGLHVAGALKHALINRDGVLRRMIFG